MAIKRINYKIFFSIILSMVASYVYAAECGVVNYKPHNNQRTGVGIVIPGTDLANVPVFTERCAQILLKCSGYGSILVEANELIATFADGSKRTGHGRFGRFRLHGGESKMVYACFGSSNAPILNIEGKF